jgi:hypothetical protein
MYICNIDIIYIYIYIYIVLIRYVNICIKMFLKEKSIYFVGKGILFLVSFTKYPKDILDKILIL